MTMKDDGYSYRNLILWQKAQELTLDIVKAVGALRKDAVTSVAVPQVIRSASSIAANIAEGHGRYVLGHTGTTCR